jgi:hypothetical protein
VVVLVVFDLNAFSGKGFQVDNFWQKKNIGHSFLNF